MKGGAANDSSELGVVRVSQAAALLSVSPRTVWRMIAEGQLTAVRFRRCTRVGLAEVRKYMMGSGAKSL